MLHTLSAGGEVKRPCKTDQQDQGQVIGIHWNSVAGNAFILSVILPEMPAEIITGINNKENSGIHAGGALHSA